MWKFSKFFYTELNNIFIGEGGGGIFVLIIDLLTRSHAFFENSFNSWKAMLAAPNPPGAQLGGPGPHLAW